MPVTDQLFKEILHEFLPDFVHLFFPDVGDRLDFERIEFRDTEVFTDFPHGDVRSVDVVAEVRTRSAEAPDHELILIHTEVQGKRRQDFPERMEEYRRALKSRAGLPVFPIAVFLSPGAGGTTWEQCVETVCGYTINTFCYAVVDLPDLRSSDYSQHRDAFAAAVSTAMAPHPTGRASHKVTALRRIAGSDLSEAKKLLLATFVETFLPLSSGEETAEFAKLLALDESQEVRKMISVYEQRGIEQGIEQGVVRGKRETLLTLMRAKFGPVPAAVTKRIQTLSSTEELDRLSTRVLTAASVEEMGIS